MAKKISQLTQATEVKSDDVTVIVQDGETKKLPLNMMVTKQDVENKKIAGLAKLDEIEATYENDTYTPTITVKNKSSVKTGEGDEVDYSANVMDGHVKSAILSGRTEVTGYSYNGYMLNNHGILSANGMLTTAGTSGWSATDSLIKLESGEYYIEDDGTSGDGYTYVYFYTENGVYLNSKSRIDVGVANRFNIDELSYVKLSRRKSSVKHLKIYRKEDLKLSSVKLPVLTTSNEDGTKTNILSCNEEVTLRGIGDVRDELDLTTGKLTQRICEVVLDGIEDTNNFIVADGELTNTARFRYRVSELGFPNAICKCDKMRAQVGYSLDYEHVYINKNDIWFFF